MQTRRLHWMLIALVVISGWGAGASEMANPAQIAQAQDAEILYGLRTEVLFPVVVRFMAGVNLPVVEIESVTITVRQEARLDETFVFRPNEHLLADFGGAVELVYDWPLTGEVLPVPFRPVDYIWQVQTADGQSSEAAAQFIFEDSTVGVWETASGGPVALHWYSPRLAGASLHADLMRAIALLGEHVARVPSLEFAIYDPGAKLCQTVTDADGTERLVVVSSQDGRQYSCSEQEYEALYTRQGITYIKRDRYGYSILQDSLVSAVVRETYRSLWRGKAIPAWFEVGLAGMYHLLPNNTALEVARIAGRSESLLSLDMLVFEPPDDWPLMQRALWESQSYLLVLYLADQFGAEAPFELAEQLAEGTDSFEVAFAAYTGRDLRVYWAEWQRWLFAQNAVDATRWTPYLLTTPTPTPTATATVTVPTPSPTMIPTYTPTGEFVPPDTQ